MQPDESKPGRLGQDEAEIRKLAESESRDYWK